MRGHDAAVGAGPFAHLAHVDAGADAGEIRLFAVRLLQPQRERDRGTRRLEGQEAAVAGPVDHATGRSRRERAHEHAMRSDELADALVPLLRLQRRRVRGR